MISELHRKLAGDAGVIAWSELERHFARGAVLVVAEPLDLIDAAAALVRDDAGAVALWLERGWLVRATDDHARAFTADRHPLRAVVVAPWVLVRVDVSP